MSVTLRGANELIPTTGRRVDPLKLYKGQLYQNIRRELDSVLFTLALDMLDLHCEGHITPGSDAAPYQELPGGVVLEWQGKGTPMFQHSFAVYVDGEKFGTLHAHPRSEGKGFKARSVQVHVENALLYTDYWHDQLLHVLDSCGLVLRNVTRLDICLDGLNHIIPFLNLYQKQFADTKTVHHKGKARFTAGVLDRQTMLYDHFKIGSGTSEKQISVYNKTKELERSNKTYIEAYWKANGVQTDCPVYRVELRLRSKAVKELKDFHISKLTDYHYLFSIFRTGCENYFEFTQTKGHQNVTRQQKIELIPFDRLGAVLLEKVPRPLSDGRYKAKMAVHLTVKDLVMQNIPEALHTESLSMLQHEIQLYDLRHWFVKRFPDWLVKYGKLAEARREAQAPPPHLQLHDFYHRYAHTSAAA